MMRVCRWGYHGPKIKKLGNIEPYSYRRYTDTMCDVCAKNVRENVGRIKMSKKKIRLIDFVRKCGSQREAARLLHWNPEGICRALRGQLKPRGALKAILTQNNIDIDNLENNK